MLSEIPAVILCGGASSRMGEAKHNLNFGRGLAWQVMKATLEKVFSSVYISCRSEQVDDFPSIECIPDVHSSIGPMGGILSAFEERSSSSIFFVGCDLPSFDASIASQILQANRPDVFATCARAANSDYPEPLVAVWNQTALKSLKQAAQRGDYSLMKTLRNNPISTVSVNADYLVNVNTAEEFSAAKARLTNQPPQQQ